MLKKIIFFITFLVCNTTYTMELSLPLPSPLPNCPKEIHETIFSYAISDWQSTGNWKENKKKFKKAVKTCRTIQLISKKYSTIDKIAQLMNINDTNKNMLLIRAAKNGTICLIKYAITRKATLDYTENNHETDIRVTPLSMAVRGNHYKSCLCLLQASAKVNKEEEEEEVHEYEHKKEWVWPSNNQPIHIAVKNNHLKITDLLITYGADINSRSSQFYDTPLEIAYKNIPKNALLINLLKKHGAKKLEWARASTDSEETDNTEESIDSSNS